ncbi:hypothetical protein ACLB1N_00570 [Escherichia coli]
MQQDCITLVAFIVVNMKYSAISISVIALFNFAARFLIAVILLQPYCAERVTFNFDQVYICVCCKIAASEGADLDSWFYFQKGGVGKSTKARALAREASACCGIKTKLADLGGSNGSGSGRSRLSAGLSPVASVEVFSTAER